MGFGKYVLPVVASIGLLSGGCCSTSRSYTILGTEYNRERTELGVNLVRAPVKNRDADSNTSEASQGFFLRSTDRYNFRENMRTINHDNKKSPGIDLFIVNY